MSINILNAYQDFTWENFSLIGKEISKIDREDINGELVQHPMIFQQYMSLLGMSKRELDEANNNLLTLASLLRKSYKEEAGSKKITAKDLDDLVFGDPKYSAALDEASAANHKYLMVKGMVTTLEHKKDCLVQLSSNSRQETKLYS